MLLQCPNSEFSLKVDSLSVEVREGFFLTRRKKIVNNLSFEVPKGSLTGFIGNNGSGKSTTIRCLLGFQNAMSGQVLFFGEHLLGPKVLMRLGFYPEKVVLPSHMSGESFLRFHAQLSGVPSSQVETRVQDWLKLVQLWSSRHLALGKYSKGMQQRLGLAQALLHQPELVILDEPMSGLDPIGRRLFRDILVDTNSMGVTIFFSTHLLSDVEKVCDQVVLLRHGERVRFEDEILEKNIEARLLE